MGSLFKCALKMLSMVYLLIYVSKWLITIKKVRIPYSIHVKITSTAAPQGTLLKDNKFLAVGSKYDIISYDVTVEDGCPQCRWILS